MAKEAIIIATGPSLTAEDCEYAAGRALAYDLQIYAVSNAYMLLPFAHHLYSCDLEWWDLHAMTTRELCRAGRIGRRWTANLEAAQKYHLWPVRGQNAEAAKVDFDISGTGIIYGANSGFQAVNLAYAHGIRKAILLGFDMGYERGQKSHFFGDHPLGLQKPSPFHDFIRAFERAAPAIAAAGMQVINCSRETRLECFPRKKLEDVL